MITTLDLKFILQKEHFARLLKRVIRVWGSLSAPWYKKKSLDTVRAEFVRKKNIQLLSALPYSCYNEEGGRKCTHEDSPYCDEKDSLVGILSSLYIMGNVLKLPESSKKCP